VRDVLDAPATPFTAAVAATTPGGGWAARIDDVQAGEAGLVVRARTSAGDEVVLQLPPDAPALPGATITVSPP